MLEETWALKFSPNEDKLQRWEAAAPWLKLWRSFCTNINKEWTYFSDNSYLESIAVAWSETEKD